MSVFTGKHVHTLDEKGRVSVPAQFRRHLPNEGLFVGKGPEGCLVLYTPEKWSSVMRGLSALSRNNRVHRSLLREVSQHIRQVNVDGQGRITIPSELLTLAGIGHEVLFLGLLDSIEIWDPGRYSSYADEGGTALEDALEEIEVDIY